MFEIALAANYMAVQELMDLLCALIAYRIKGQPADQIRQVFGIENDFSEAELAKIDAENKMAEENF